MGFTNICLRSSGRPDCHWAVYTYLPILWPSLVSVSTVQQGQHCAALTKAVHLELKSCWNVSWCPLLTWVMHGYQLSQLLDRGLDAVSQASLSDNPTVLARRATRLILQHLVCFPRWTFMQSHGSRNFCPVCSAELCEQCNL